jgi:hypothetical protein
MLVSTVLLTPPHLGEDDEGAMYLGRLVPGTQPGKDAVMTSEVGYTTVAHPISGAAAERTPSEVAL